jgi:MFS family permease
LALSGHPSSGLVVTACLILVGGISLSSLSFTKQWKPERRKSGGQTLFKTPGFRLLIAEGVLIGYGTGTYQIAIPAISSLHNEPRFAGLAFGTTAALSIFGSLVAGSLGRHIAPVQGFRIIYLFWFLTTIPLAFTNPGWSLLLALSLFGFISGAEQVFYLEQLEVIRPQGSAAAAIGWIWTIEGTFTALGQSSGGYISQHFSPHFCFAITSLMFAIGFALIIIGKRWLKPFDRSRT